MTRMLTTRMKETPKTPPVLQSGTHSGARRTFLVRTVLQAVLAGEAHVPHQPADLPAAVARAVLAALPGHLQPQHAVPVAAGPAGGGAEPRPAQPLLLALGVVRGRVLGQRRELALLGEVAVDVHEAVEDAGAGAGAGGAAVLQVLLGVVGEQAGHVLAHGHERAGPRCLLLGAGGGLLRVASVSATGGAAGPVVRSAGAVEHEDGAAEAALEVLLDAAQDPHPGEGIAGEGKVLDMWPAALGCELGGV